MEPGLPRGSRGERPPPGRALGSVWHASARGLLRAANYYMISSSLWGKGLKYSAKGSGHGAVRVGSWVTRGRAALSEWARTVATGSQHRFIEPKGGVTMAVGTEQRGEAAAGRKLHRDVGRVGLL